MYCPISPVCASEKILPLLWFKIDNSDVTLDLYSPILCLDSYYPRVNVSQRGLLCRIPWNFT
uniref:Uncharacterized protein n=1 Tax=Rhizophora mucronata TaxID=61149 RepID=A0A2P2Q402_RHIMU